MRIIIALLCSCVVMSIGSAFADEPTCSAIKRALVSSNRALMRIERGPLPVAPVQASMAIGQMTALDHIAQLACSPEDADKIDLVVTPRVDALQRLLPVEPADAGQASTPNLAEADSSPPTPPPRPASAAGVQQRSQSSASATTCTRIYYLKGGYRYWRCKR